MGHTVLKKVEGYAKLGRETMGKSVNFIQNHWLPW